ncbi:hypothetical protein M0R45_031370 [Rubus argutus]|uniref:Uncharacterized protein n=1 Tax=Rubus argutus TaxID=59490 RepID=A0AAW1WH30_RUBAR
MASQTHPNLIPTSPILITTTCKANTKINKDQLTFSASPSNHQSTQSTKSSPYPITTMNHCNHHPRPLLPAPISNSSPNHHQPISQFHKSQTSKPNSSPLLIAATSGSPSQAPQPDRRDLHAVAPITETAPPLFP